MDTTFTKTVRNTFLSEIPGFLKNSVDEKL